MVFYRRRKFTRRPNYRKRRPNRSSYRRYKRKSYRPLKIGGFPQTKYVKLRYAYRSLLSCSDAGQNYVSIRSNDIYDPETAVGGGQPGWHDTWQQIYYKYCVVGAKCTVRFAQVEDTSNALAPLAVVLSHGDSADPTAFSDYTNMRMNGNTVSRLINPGSSYARPLTQYFSLKKYLRANGGASSSFVTAFGSNPTDLFYFLLSCHDADPTGTNVPVKVVADIQVDYIVKLSHLRDITES